ncbi:MAG: hypothetical protein AAFR74_02365 [Pseudomonadota bacterium]
MRLIFVFFFAVLVGLPAFAQGGLRSFETFWTGWRTTGDGFVLAGWTCDRDLQDALKSDAARLSVRGDSAAAPGRWNDLPSRPTFGRFMGEDLIDCGYRTGPISIELPFTRDDLFQGSGNKATPRFSRVIISVRSGYYWSTYTYGRNHRSAQDTRGISIDTPRDPLSLSYWAQNDTWINQLFRPQLGPLSRREAPRAQGNLGLSPQRVIELFQLVQQQGLDQGFSGVSQAVMFADFALWNVGAGASGSDEVQARLTAQTANALDKYWSTRLEGANPCRNFAADDEGLANCDYLFQLRARSTLGGLLALYEGAGERLKGPRILSVRLNDKHQTDRFLNANRQTSVSVLGRAMTAGANRLACFSQGRDGSLADDVFCAGELDTDANGEKSVKVHEGREHIVLDFSDHRVRSYKRWLVKDLARHAAETFYGLPEQDTVFELDFNRTYNFGEARQLWTFLRLLTGDAGKPCEEDRCDIREYMPDAHIIVRLPASEESRSKTALSPARLAALQVDGIILSNEKQVASNSLKPLFCNRRITDCVFPESSANAPKPGLIMLDLFHKTARAERSGAFRPLTAAEMATYWHTATRLLDYDGMSIFNHFYYYKDYPEVWASFTKGDRFGRKANDPLHGGFGRQHYTSDTLWRSTGIDRAAPVELWLNAPLTGWDRSAPGLLRVNLSACQGAEAANPSAVAGAELNGVRLIQKGRMPDPQREVMPKDWRDRTSQSVTFELPPVPRGQRHYIYTGLNRIDLQLRGEATCIPLVELIVDPAKNWTPRL